MTTPAEIEAALFALPPAERGDLLGRAFDRHEEECGEPPPLTPEQVQMLNDRIAAIDRGEVELLTHEEVLAHLDERIAAARRKQEQGELADAA